MRAHVFSVTGPFDEPIHSIEMTADTMAETTLVFTIGPKGAPGGEQFRLNIVTPGWLESNLDKPIFGRHLLISQSLANIDRIVANLVRDIESLEKEGWNQIADVLTRYFSWEFEDYDVSEVGW